MDDSAHNSKAGSSVRGDAILGAVIDALSVAIAVIDADGVIILINQSWRNASANTGQFPRNPPLRTEVGTNYLAVCERAVLLDSSDESARSAVDGIKAVLDGRVASFNLEYACHPADQKRWFRMSVTPLDVDGKRGATITRIPMEESKRIEQELVESEERFARFMDALPAAAFIKDEEGTIVYVNRVMAEIIGPRAWLQKSTRDLFPRELAEKMIADDRHALEDGNVVAEERVPTSDGQQRYYETHKFRIPRKGRPPMIGAIALDITERKRMEDQVHQLAFYDQLTNLPNRRLLRDRLSHTMAAIKRSGWYCALMFVDLDNFKSINDTLGHRVGDVLLVEAAERLKRCIRETDTVARFGGDEFVVMISELDVEKAKAGLQAGIVAEKLRAAMAEPYSLRIQRPGGQEATVEWQSTASIGVALFNQDESNQDNILGWADSAMYEAKEAGCNLIRFHDPAASLKA